MGCTGLTGRVLGRFDFYILAAWGSITSENGSLGMWVMGGSQKTMSGWVR